MILMITVLSQAELVKLGAELATVASASMAAGVTAGLGGLATVAPVLGVLAAVAAWYCGVPLPIPPIP